MGSDLSLAIGSGVRESIYIYIYTPGSMNSLFGDFFKEFWRGILGGVRDYLGEVLVGF